MTTFVPVPQFTLPESHPLFVRYRVGGIARQVKELVDWSKMEHAAALRYYSQKGDLRTFTYLANEFSYIRVLSLRSEFYYICNLLLEDSEVWNALDGATRKAISHAYEFAKKSGLV